MSRTKDSAGKKYSINNRWFQNRRIATAGVWADSWHFKMVEEAQFLRSLRASPGLRKAYGQHSFDRHWDNWHNKLASYLGYCLLGSKTHPEPDPKPFQEFAKAVEAFNSIRKGGAPYDAVRQGVLDLAQELRVFAGQEGAKVTFKKFSAIWEKRLKRRGKIAVSDPRVLRRICVELGIQLTPDKLGAPRKSAKK